MRVWPVTAIAIGAVLLVVTAAMGQKTAEVEQETAEESRRLKVTAVKEQLTVEAIDVPLGELLMEVGRVAGITVALDNALPLEEAARPVSVTFENVTADEAFRRLLRGYHAVYRYTAMNPGLTSLTVYGPVVPARSGFSVPAREREQTATAAPNAEQQSEALRRLADRNDPAARDAAVDILARATQPELIEDALDVLDNLDSVPAEPLLAFAGGQRPAALRGQALRVLVRHWPKDPRVAALVRASTRDPDAGVSELARALLELVSGD